MRGLENIGPLRASGARLPGARGPAYPPRVARFPLVFIAGVGHSGSNLLSRLLARHPQAACVGETAWVDYAVAQGTPCTCGLPYADCPYWGPLLPRLKGRGDYAYKRFRPELFQELRRAAGADVVIDNSKTRGWQLARRWPGVGFILLVRDARGVLSSGLRKGGDLGHVLRRHRKWTRRFARLARRRAAETLVLRYEDLVRAPGPELARIVGFLGLAPEPDLLRPSARPYHFMYSKKTAELDRGEELRLDERWRSELSPGDAARIAAAMGRVRFYRELYPD